MDPLTSFWKDTSWSDYHINKRIIYISQFLDMNYYLYFTNKDQKDIFKGLTQFLLIFVFLEKLIKNMEMFEKGTGLCF